MRKSYTFGIPFGLQRESGLFLDITEVSRGIDCNCICPACKTDLLAKQGEVKLWHFSHSTAVAGDCDGLMEAIRGKIIEVINEHQVRKRLVRTVLIFTESSDQLSRATDRVPGLPASPEYAQ